MSTNRYLAGVLTVIGVALLVIALVPWLPARPVVDTIRVSAAEAQSATPKYEVTVPRSWGKLVGFSNNNLLLEGADGVLRVVDVEGKPPEYPKVKVLVRWQ